MGSIIVDFVTGFLLEMLVQGPGHAILKLARSGRPHGDNAAILAGLAFWLLLALLTVLLIRGISIA